MLLPILIVGDKRLRNKSKELKKSEINEDFQKTLSDMFETMYDSHGIGLAAIQVGIEKRFLVLDLGQSELAEGEEGTRDQRVLINPEIVEREGEIEWEEGCLSCPDIQVMMTRSQKITVTYKDLNFEEQKIEAQDLLAVAIQHEIDHLDGKLIIDQLSALKKEKYIKELKSSGRRVVR